MSMSSYTEKDPCPAEGDVHSKLDGVPLSDS